MADLGWITTVVTPSYGMFANAPGAMKLASIKVPFRGEKQLVDVFEVPGTDPAVRSVVFEHDLFTPLGPGQVYSAVEDEGPFETDASKFAFFGAAAAAWIDQLPALPDVVHLHDWHAAFYLLLREFDPTYKSLRDIRTVFTIHNLSYQGTRPLRYGDSSLEAWFPELDYDLAAVRDPVEVDCINPMAMAIRLSDKIGTVSPTYAEEIRRPSNPETGFIGGEGLETEIDAVAQAGRLVGILNGCEYNGRKRRRPGWKTILTLARNQVREWLERTPGDAAHVLAATRLDNLPHRRPQHVLVSIGRLVRQKVSLFLEELEDGRTALEHIAESLGENGVFFLLGSGETEFEKRVVDIASRCERLVFLRGYSESLAAPLYRVGDLFLMPSSFEPCGISQMLAMRAAQPCVVHAVGGLRDTVNDGQTGFTFSGGTPVTQAKNFVTAVDRALNLRSADDDKWQSICIRAASQRFDWSTSAQQTIENLYDAAV